MIGEPFNNEEWELVHYPSDCPFQGWNNNACGVIISAIGDLLSQDLPLNFRLSDVLYYRKRTTLSILGQEHPFSPVVPISKDWRPLHEMKPKIKKSLIFNHFNHDRFVQRFVQRWSTTLPSVGQPLLPALVDCFIQNWLTALSSVGWPLCPALVNHFVQR